MKQITVTRKTSICILLCTFLFQSFAQTINKVEYFVDTDPGFGNGTDVFISSLPDIPNLVIPVDVTSLSVGLHNIFIRSLNNQGNWSLTNHLLFFKDKATASVNRIEYFIDTDPGFGNAVNPSIGTGADINGITIPVNVNALPVGLHNIFIRSQDELGKWSLTNHLLFFKDKTQGNLRQGEYFFDTDPGCRYTSLCSKLLSDQAGRY